MKRYLSLSRSTQASLWWLIFLLSGCSLGTDVGNGVKTDSPETEPTATSPEVGRDSSGPSGAPTSGSTTTTEPGSVCSLSSEFQRFCYLLAPCGSPLSELSGSFFLDESDGSQATDVFVVEQSDLIVFSLSNGASIEIEAVASDSNPWEILLPEGFVNSLSCTADPVNTRVSFDDGTVVKWTVSEEGTEVRIDDQVWRSQ